MDELAAVSLDYDTEPQRLLQLPVPAHIHFRKREKRYYSVRTIDGINKTDLKLKKYISAP
jgi:hypothetical protein